MSHELFELFGMLGVGVGLTAHFQRAVQPALLRLAANAAAPMRSSAVRRQPSSELVSNAVSRRSDCSRSPDSTT